MQSRTSLPPHRPSFCRDDVENSSLAQVLSQRLANMEQQLFLLRDDLKNAVGTLKEKDREILSLQNRIGLAERRRELEEAGKPVDESLKDVSASAGSKLNLKRDKLENEVVTLAKKLEEMEKFFGDYGLAWVKEDALDEKDPNNLWIRKSNIHYTPDFDKVFLVVEELNLGNAEPQIVRKGNTAQFKTAQLLNLTLYADGIQLENNPFRKYDSPSVEEFFRDLEDGYFPTELKGSHPEGVIFKVKDRRTINFADDPDKRPVISNVAKSNVISGSTPCSPSSLSSLRAASRRSASPGGSGSGTSKGQMDKISRGSLPSSSSRKRGSPKRRSSLKKTPGKRSRSTDVRPVGPVEEPKENIPLVPPVIVGEESVGSKKPIKPADAEEATKPEIPADGKEGNPTGEGTPVLPNGTPEQAPLQSVKPPVPSSEEKPNSENEFKELFRGRTPGTSAQRLPEHAVEPTLEALAKDAYGLPRPPFPSTSNTNADVRPLPLGPPSKQFDNFVFPKTSETQTSLTLLPGIRPDPMPPSSTTCAQPTHVTNITYNEAPITVQMTPSEFARAKSGGTEAAGPQAMQRELSCPTHHPHPCNCPRVPCDSCPDEPKDAKLGSVGLAKFPAETEYREKFTESAINNQNVLGFKSRSPEVKGHSPSPVPVPRQPAATVLVGPDEAPVPPDPVQPRGPVDPNEKWEHFTYLGHPKDQEPAVAPELPKTPNPQRKPSPQPQVVQLNQKTSDRMIPVQIKTKSGSREFLAHLYPDEGISKAQSLLKMKEGTRYLTINSDDVVPPDAGATGVTAGQVFRVISSKRAGSMVTTRFDHNKFPEFTTKDPEYFKTQADEKKKSPGKIKMSNPNQTGARDRTDARTMTDLIDEVKVMMKEDGDDESGDIYISPHENRDFLSKKVYRKQHVPRVPSKELERMLAQFKDQSSAPNKLTMKASEVPISESQLATFKSPEQHPGSSPPRIVADDTLSGTSVPPLYTEDSHGVLDAPKSEHSLRPGIELSRSSSLISESKVHIGSYTPEPRREINKADPGGPPADYPGSSDSIDQYVPSGKLPEFRSRSSHSLVFKRENSLSRVVSRSQSRVVRTGALEGVHEEGVEEINQPAHSSRVPVNEAYVEKQSNLERSSGKASSATSLNGMKGRDPGPSGIGIDGFETATLLDIVRAMQEAEREHERDNEKLERSYRIVVPKPSPELSPKPSGFHVPEGAAKELETLRVSSKPLLPTNRKITSSHLDRTLTEQLLEEIRTKRCTLDEAIREISKRFDSTH